MSNSELAKFQLNGEINYLKHITKVYENIFNSLDFITIHEAMNLLDVSYNEIKEIIKEKQIIFFNFNLNIFIPIFQFESNKINPLFVDLLNYVRDDLNSEYNKDDFRNKNIIIHTLLEEFSFYYDNEFGTKLYGRLNGIEYIKQFGKKVIKKVAYRIRSRIYSKH